MALKKNVHHWLDQLQPPQRELIIRRFGLLAHKKESIQELAQAIGKKPLTVRRLISRSLKRLRQIIKNSK